ncbi:MAG: response regulator [Lentisphaerota bacterium]
MNTTVSVLMVEDNPEHAEAIRRAFESSGESWDLRSSTSLAEARKVASGALPDIVLADLKLPDGVAYELLASSPLARQCPVLIMTSFGDEQMAVQAIKSGALDYVVKSAEAFQTMPATIRRSLREWQIMKERQVAVETLKLRESYLTAIIENQPGLVWLKDVEGRFLAANLVFAQSCGRKSPQDVIGKTDLDVWPKDLAEQYRMDDEIVLCTGKPVAVEEKIFDQKEERWFETFKTPVVDSNGKVIGTTGFARDITERKKAEAERLDMERRLLHTQKLESLGILAGGIAHDFNNLLMAILGNLDLALQDLSPLSPARTSVEQALQASRHAADLTRQMLAYSGKGSFVLRPLDLSELVEENAHILKAAIDKNVNLKLSLAHQLPPITVDPGQLQQVIMNLITNASEAIGEQPGVVSLATGVDYFDEASLSNSKLVEKPRPGCFVWLEVSDTGCGMDDVTQLRIFDPFFTTKFSGRGLGLSAVLGIIRGHQGAIMVESTLGRGSKIRVLIPAQTTEAVAREAKKTRLENAAIAAKPVSGVVLVVDDETMVRELCHRMLERLGFRVFTAVDGQDALSVFQGHADEIDCVLLDLTMPRMDGVATFSELRRLRPNLRIILSSGYSHQEAIHRFGGQGLAGFIQKPYQLRTLQDEFRRVMGEKGAVPPQASG